MRLSINYRLELERVRQLQFNIPTRITVCTYLAVIKLPCNLATLLKMDGEIVCREERVYIADDGRALELSRDTLTLFRFGDKQS